MTVPIEFDGVEPSSSRRQSGDADGKLAVSMTDRTVPVRAI